MVAGVRPPPNVDSFSQHERDCECNTQGVQLATRQFTNSNNPAAP